VGILILRVLGSARSLGFALVVLYATGAQAVPTTWRLSNVKFEDGGRANGSLVYDADTDTFSNILISTTTTPTRTGAIYKYINPSALVWPMAPDLINIFTNSNDRDLLSAESLWFVYQTPLSNAGGSIGIKSPPGGASWEGTCGQSNCLGVQGNWGTPLREVISGSVKAAPAPVQSRSPKNYGLFVGTTDPGPLFWGIQHDMHNDAVAELLAQTFSLMPNYGDSRVLKVDLFDRNHDGFSDKPLIYSDLVNAIDQLRNQMQPGDKFFLYFGSHGGTVGQRIFLPNWLPTLPGNETTASPGNEALGLGLALTDDDLYNILKNHLNGYDKLVFIDSCHSGGFWGDYNSNDVGDLEKLGRTGLLAAAAEDKLSFMNSSGEGVFGLALNYALGKSGGYVRADRDRDGQFDLQDIANAVRRALRNMPGPNVGNPVLYPMGWEDPVPYSQDLFSVTVFSTDDLEDSFSSGKAGEVDLPTPGTLVLVGLGLTGLAAARRRPQRLASPKIEDFQPITEF